MKTQDTYAFGLDFGTNSCRSLLVNLQTGEEVATSVFEYPSGDLGIIVDSKDVHIARQNPQDYIDGVKRIIKDALVQAHSNDKFDANQVISIGIDTTGSTPIPLDELCVPLSLNSKFSNNINALAWLWKDHSSIEEAKTITETANKIRPEYLNKCGGTYSSEWFWSKLWRLSKVDTEVYNAMGSFVELCDYLPAMLTGIKDTKAIKRSQCAAGHKAMFNKQWNGLPDSEFLNALDNNLSDSLNKLYTETYTSDQSAGTLCNELAKELGLSEDVVISIGAFDAHVGAVGSGIRPGTMVKIMGTSTCDIIISPESQPLKDIPGVCGIVEGSVRPDHYGIEAGQSAVGDIFLWFVNNLVPDSYGKTQTEKFIYLEKAASKLKPGESGLLALDWSNGNRTVLVDTQLTGLILGQTLQTKAHEIYRALIEATAFGALTIINRIEDYGVTLEQIVNCGGLATKNGLLMQIYADIINKPMLVVKSDQTCALGAALLSAVATGKENGGYESIDEGQKHLCSFRDIAYEPNSENGKQYKDIYTLYKKLHDSFGTAEWSGSLYDVMKSLLKIQQASKQG